jgi:hypothetical protein
MGTYTSYARNTLTGFFAVPVNVTLTGPALVLSRTLDGPAASTLPAGQTIYGRIAGLGASNVQTCVEAASASTCASLVNWTTLPGGGWTFDAPTSTWRLSYLPNTVAPGDYVSHARNTLDDTRALVPVTVTGPVIIYSNVLDGPPRTMLSASQPIYGRITGSGPNTQACTEPQGSGGCASLSTWATFPANGWTFDGLVWRATISASAFPAGIYVSYARNAADNSNAAPVTITLLP